MISSVWGYVLKNNYIATSVHSRWFCGAAKKNFTICEHNIVTPILYKGGNVQQIQRIYDMIVGKGQLLKREIFHTIDDPKWEIVYIRKVASPENFIAGTLYKIPKLRYKGWAAGIFIYLTPSYELTSEYTIR